MKKVLILSFFSFFSFAETPSLDAVAFAAKHSFDSKLVKDVKYIQGKHFELNSKIEAYSLFFHGTVNGIRQNIKVNCKASKVNGDISGCKPVKMTPIK